MFRRAPVQWTKVMRTTFRGAKASLGPTAELAHPLQGTELVIMADASTYHVGISLQQQVVPWKLLGFNSKKLEPAQTHHFSFDRELLACISEILNFRFKRGGD